MHGPEHKVEHRREKVSAVGASGLLALALWTVLSAYSFAGVSRPHSWNGSNQQQNAMEIAAFTRPIKLGSTATRVVLQDSGAQAAGRGLDVHVRALPAGRRVYLVLRNLRVAQQPGVLYHVYLDLPEDAKPRKSDARHAGVLNFFGATQLTDSGRAEEAAFRSYDITNLVKSLHARKLLSEPSTVTIIPSATPAANAEATIGRIEVVEQ
jgi:hypothetical protein